MKNLFLYLYCLFLSIVPLTVSAQDALWPVSGKKAGDGIIYRPQDYIGDELNSDRLIITAPEGSEIVSPVSGVISAYNYVFMKSLNHGSFYKATGKTDEEQRTEISQSIWEKDKKKADLKCITALLSITTPQGEKIYIAGIYPVENLKTGMRIKQGDKIGTLGHFYRIITEPAISISRTVNGRSADPMSPFGLKSTFIAPQKQHMDPKHKYTVSQLQSDFLMLRESMEEGHPGLYDYSTKQQMDSIFDKAYEQINREMTAYEFYQQIYSLMAEVRDGHLYVSRVDSPISSESNQTSITFGLFNDTLRVHRVSGTKDLDLINKEIVAVDGIDANRLKTEIKRIGEKERAIQDGFIENTIITESVFFYATYMNHYPLKKEGITLTFADGTERTFPFIDEKACANYQPPVKYRLRSDRDVIYKKIDEKTALLDINTFYLSDMDSDSIRFFIKDIVANRYENLIIDVRYNDGGEAEKVKELFSYLANESYQIDVDLKVNKNDTYDFFQHSTNYSPETRHLFPEYIWDEERKGYYMPKEKLPWYQPSDSIHFNGRVYVLTDERSFSAASVFPGLVHKYKRGVIVGGETGSTYHRFYAHKFATVFLKNTGLTVRIPLVKCIFDYPEDSDIPWGRGVLPDYPVAFSVDELIGDRDVILDYTLHLIEDDKYLKEDVELKDIVESQESNNTTLFLVIICLVLVVIFVTFYILRYRSKQTKNTEKNEEQKEEK